MHMLKSMRITAKKDDVLTRLKSNREEHKKIVVEARDGYLKKARAALEERMKDLSSGKLVSLFFALAPPQDHTRVYDVTIEMLSLHTGAEIELDAEQVRNLMMDEWDWSQQFLTSNSAYSGTAAAKLAVDEDIGASL